ncbi:LexA family transcriptional regulator [Alloalcanivorax marinus]|uniref:LexA family transcriptional regulator n=1 Tax=Alloalcanivorax marinus TaxID=1177169 RepID=UPI0019323147|nr:LexA family transcriptional regulator [Alloalcanivorax marinus]MBL7251476.1 helix-turn-helix domain-containing protein [Alloalcanivorax marinus]
MVHIIDGLNAEFATRVRDARKEKKLTQQELAESIGVDKRTISMYENGRMFPQGNTLQRLATELRLDPLWLATGQTEETQNHLASQYQKAKDIGLPEKVSQIFIEDWRSLQAGTNFHLPRYSPSSSTGGQNFNIRDFVPVVKTDFDQYRATRYPATHPQNSTYPAESILIFDAGITTFEKVENGDDIIFRFHGKENEAGLRRFVREPGVPQGALFSIHPLMPLDPIPADKRKIEILGVVVTQVITRRS